MIYEAFVNQYMEEQRQKQIQRGVKNLGGLMKAAQPYAIQLALTFFAQDRAAVSYQPRSPFNEFAPSSTAAFDRFFHVQRESQNHRLAQVIPLQITTQENKREVTTVTQYSFIHKSILDYFTALGLVAEVDDLMPPGSGAADSTGIKVLLRSAGLRLFSGYSEWRQKRPDAGGVFGMGGSVEVHRALSGRKTALAGNSAADSSAFALE